MKDRLESLCVELIAEYVPVKTVRGGNRMYDCPMCGVSNNQQSCSNPDCWIVRLRDAMKNTGRDSA